MRPEKPFERVHHPYLLGDIRYTYHPVIKQITWAAVTNPIVSFQLVEGPGPDVLAAVYEGDPQQIHFPIDAENITEDIMESWTIAEACETQAKYCREHNLKMVAPPDGICFGCRSQIYTMRSGRGYLEQCPSCDLDFTTMRKPHPLEYKTRCTN